MKNEYYSLTKILERDSHYNVIISERSDGKTYAVLHYALKLYFKTGEQLAIVRRWSEDFIGATSMRTCYNSLECNGDGENAISELSGGYFTKIVYYAGMYYLAYDDGDGNVIRSDKIVAYAFALNTMEHSKSAAFPHVTTILFDEFMSRDKYLADEFVLFQNTLSTIIRKRDNVKIFMCANTVNKYGCPYFNEMGLTHVKNMKIGDIDVYQYGENGKLRVAVEFSGGHNKKGKPSDVYFAFNNPRLQMITGQGNVWEMNIYPHCPVEYAPKDVLFVFIVIFDGETIQGNVIVKDGLRFIFFHRKTTPIKDEDRDLIYSPDYDARPNHRRNIFIRQFPVEDKIAELFRSHKVFYADNEVGEIIRNYLEWCRSNK